MEHIFALIWLHNNSIILIWLAPTNSSNKTGTNSCITFFIKSSFRSTKRHPVRMAPVHLRLNQFRMPIFFQTFQYRGGQGCHTHLIKSEYSIISKSIAVFYSHLEWAEPRRARNELMPSPFCAKPGSHTLSYMWSERSLFLYKLFGIVL